jgi:hypothetical protein
MLSDMKSIKCLFLLFLLSYGVNTNAQLTECWAPSNWSISPSSNPSDELGHVIINENSIVLNEAIFENGTGLDVLDCSSTIGSVSACITVPVTGDITFDWNLPGGPLWSPFVERFGYCIDGVATELTDLGPPPFGTSSGTETIAVTEGSEFCFIFSTKWADLAQLDVTVDNFDMPACDGCDIEPLIDITPADIDDIYCPGDVITLSTQESDSYQWFYNFSNSNTGGTAVDGGSTQSIVLNATEWAVVYFYVESTIGECTVASPTVVWDAWNFLPPSISHPSLLDYCEGEVITISNAFPGPVSFQWYRNGNAIPGATDANFEVTESGTYVLEAAYGECPNFFQSSGVGPTFTFFETTTPTISELGGTLTSTAALSYQWSLNSEEIPGATSQSYNPSEDGIYTVTITDSNGCEVTSAAFVVGAIECPGDFNGDLIVDVADFLLFNSAYGASCTCPEDMDGSGTVEVNDFLLFNSVFGTDCN